MISLLFLSFLLQAAAVAQTIAVSGQCMTGTITLNKIADFGGRVAYEGTGTVVGTAGVTVDIFCGDYGSLL